MTPCRLTRIVRERAKSCPCNRTTMRSIARAPKYRRFCLRPRRVPFGRLRRDLSNVCYVDVRLLQRISRVVSGIRADTISDAWPHVSRCGFSEIERSPPCSRPTLRSTFRAPHYRRSGRLLRRRSLGQYGVLPVLSAEFGPTSFPMRSPMSIDLVCPR